MNQPHAPTRRRCLFRLTLPALAALPIGRANAQQVWPTRPITLMVPWPAGNPTDAIARKLQPLLAKALGQTVIVDNVAGAGGTLGASKVVGQPHDGTQILMGTPTELILSPLTIPAARYGPTDFRMVGLLGRVPYLLAARPDLPLATLGDVVALRDSRGATPVSLGNIGPGSMIHLISTQFARVSRVPVNHIPYKGVPPLVQDLLGSQLDLAFVPVNGSTMTYIEQGKLRSFGLTTRAPFTLFPTLRPMTEASKAFEDFEFEVWGGMFVPKDTPSQVQQRLHKVFYEVTADADFRQWARSTGSDLAPPLGLADLDMLYQRDIARYQALSKSIPAGS